MRPGGGRTKGATFEQSVARDLRAWLGDDWAVARLRTDQQQGTDHAGEFSVEHARGRFPFSIECKHHKSFSVVQLWKGTGPLASWWAQASAQAAQCDRSPLLLVRVPRGPVLAFVRLAAWLPMTNAGPSRARRMYLELDGEIVVVMPWEALTSIDPTWLAEVGR